MKRDGFEAKCWRRLDVRTPAAELDGSGHSVGERKRMDPASPLVVDRYRRHLLIVAFVMRVGVDKGLMASISKL